MISFTCDYSEGAHPEILRRLSETNLEQMAGYGADRYTVSAKERIASAVGCRCSDVYLLTGGTQTNTIVIDAVLPHYAGVIAVESGHIAVHEGGAIELFGHKVITLPSAEGKLLSEVLERYLVDFYQDPTYEHMAQPAMVYISYPTEWGTLYSKNELKELYALCKRYALKLFVDGARLGYGLASPESDITLQDLSQLCDVFYIGGTKVGALCGEAVVFPRGDVPPHFFTIIKQHGALLAKGRLLGIQFDTLFTDDLYLQISRHAVEMALRLREVFRERGVPFFVESPTNQQFPMLNTALMETLSQEVRFERWHGVGEDAFVTRFATSWCTPFRYIERLAELF